MELKLSENIRSFRKDHDLTQEQLAEIMGVMVGAVSKWESDRTTPDLSLIVRLADYFEVSVDVLLGYEVQNHSLQSAVKRLRDKTKQKDYTAGVQEAEKALLKYPYAFEAVYYSAQLYRLKGVEQRSSRDLNRSLDLYQQAEKLIQQNTNEKISAPSIRNRIAQIYLSLDQLEEGLAILKQNNIEGLNDSLIGFSLATQDDRSKREEALPFLSNALLNNYVSLFQVFIGYINIYTLREDYRAALDAVEVLLNLTASLKRPGQISFLDKVDVVFHMAATHVHLASGAAEQARDSLIRAKEQAERFDRAPDYSMHNLRFYEDGSEAFAYDDMGETARDGIERFIADIEQAEQSHKLQELWEEIQDV